MPRPNTIRNTKFQCMECGYCLFSLPVNGACPECGTSVRESVVWNQGRLPDASSQVVCAFVISVISLFFAIAFFTATSSEGFDTWPVDAMIGASGGLLFSSAAAYFARMAIRGRCRNRWFMEGLFWVNMIFVAASGVWFVVWMLK